jgi:predicted GTPase
MYVNRVIETDIALHPPVNRILYKTRLPFILVFNKTDIQPHQFAVDWMQDWQLFQQALQSSASPDGEANYMNSLMNSMCLVLDEFYEGLRTVGVSAMTGQGIKEFFEKVEEAREEYDRSAKRLSQDAHRPMANAALHRDYRPELEKQAKEKVSSPHNSYYA